MPRLRLIHWNAAEAARYLTLLKEAGHHVEYSPEFSPPLMRDWRSCPPDAFVIDLTRLPSHGREIAVALRQSKATRAVPIVFCEGEEAKIAKTRALLPDAVYCPFSRLKSNLRKLGSTRATPVVPVAMMERYAGRTVAQKLGIRAGDSVCLLEAPRDMPAGLGKLPAGVTFVESLPAAVTLFFPTDPHALRQQLSELRFFAAKTKLWVCWKKGKAAANGVSERLVRETGISLGLVDYKICSVSEVWSGLLFALQRSTTSE
jgi:CheY-like chemotaxis protein